MNNIWNQKLLIVMQFLFYNLTWYDDIIHFLRQFLKIEKHNKKFVKGVLRKFFDLFKMNKHMMLLLQYSTSPIFEVHH